MTHYKAGSVKIRDAVSSDTFELRAADKREIWKSHHRTPEQALIEGYKESIVCLTVELNGKAIAMFGIVPHTILGRTASIWFLASSEMNKIQHIFRHSRRFINLMLSYYPILENWVDIENRQSIRWLHWCGAEFSLAVPYGVEQQYFKYFRFRRN